MAGFDRLLKPENAVPLGGSAIDLIHLLVEWIVPCVIIPGTEHKLPRTMEVSNDLQDPLNSLYKDIFLSLGEGVKMRPSLSFWQVIPIIIPNIK